MQNKLDWVIQVVLNLRKGSSTLNFIVNLHLCYKFYSVNETLNFC